MVHTYIHTYVGTIVCMYMHTYVGTTVCMYMQICYINILYASTYQYIRSNLKLSLSSGLQSGGDCPLLSPGIFSKLSPCKTLREPTPAVRVEQADSIPWVWMVLNLSLKLAV